MTGKPFKQSDKNAVKSRLLSETRQAASESLFPAAIDTAKGSIDNTMAASVKGSE